MLSAARSAQFSSAKSSPPHTGAFSSAYCRVSYKQAVSITYFEPQERTQPWHSRVISDNSRFYTIERNNGDMLYDSRTDLPVDMDEWRREREERKARLFGPWSCGGLPGSFRVSSPDFVTNETEKSLSPDCPRLGVLIVNGACDIDPPRRGNGFPAKGSASRVEHHP